MSVTFIYPSTSENVDHDALRSPSKLPVESREHSAACFWFGFPFSCHAHVDHVPLRLALLLVIHQPWYDLIERKLSPSGSTQHVCDGEKWAICRDVVDEKSAEMECVQAFIEKRRYLAFDYVTKLTSTAETDQYKTYLPPDGNIIIVGAKST